MGDFIELTCPKCGFKDDDVYYAPAWGFTDWYCPYCGEFVDLEIAEQKKQILILEDAEKIEGGC